MLIIFLKFEEPENFTSGRFPADETCPNFTAQMLEWKLLQDRCQDHQDNDKLLLMQNFTNFLQEKGWTDVPSSELLILDEQQGRSRRLLRYISDFTEIVDLKFQLNDLDKSFEIVEVDSRISLLPSHRNFYQQVKTLERPKILGVAEKLVANEMFLKWINHLESKAKESDDNCPRSIVQLLKEIDVFDAKSKYNMQEEKKKKAFCLLRHMKELNEAGPMKFQINKTNKSLQIFGHNIRISLPTSYRGFFHNVQNSAGPELFEVAEKEVENEEFLKWINQTESTIIFWKLSDTFWTRSNIVQSGTFLVLVLVLASPCLLVLAHH